MKFFTTALLATAASAVTLKAADYEAPAVEHQHGRFENHTTFERQTRKHYHRRPIQRTRVETQVGYKTELEDHVLHAPETTYDTEFTFHEEDVPREVTDISYKTRERLIPKTVQEVVQETKYRAVPDVKDVEVTKYRKQVDHKQRRVPKTIFETRYKTLQRKVPKTIYEDAVRQVPRTVYDEVTVTEQRPVPVIKTRKVAKQSFEIKRETAYRTEYETKYENVPETRYRDVAETQYRTERIKKYRPITKTKTRQVPSTVPETKTRQVPFTVYDNNPNVHYFNTPVDGTETIKYGKTTQHENEDGVPYNRELWLKEDRPITTLRPHGIARDNFTARTEFREEHYEEDKTVLIDEEYEEKGFEVYYEEVQVPFEVQPQEAYTVIVRKPYKVAKRVPYEKVTKIPVTKYIDEEYETTEMQDYQVTRRVPRVEYVDETYKKEKVIYVDEDYEQAYVAPKEVQVLENYTEESQVPYTVTKKVPTTRQQAYTVDKLVERTEYDTHLYQVPEVKTSTVYDTFNFQTSEQVPTTVDKTYEYQVGKQIPVYRHRRVPILGDEEIEHTESRIVPNTELVKIIDTHSHVLDEENEHAH